MKIIRSRKVMRREAMRLKRAGKRIAFVPTMGYLHEGHLSLVRRARREGDVTVASIYVNPTQFGPREDLFRYPRDLGRDIRLLKKEKVDILFAPAEMYDRDSVMAVDPGPIQDRLCGRFRPGHFRGVATIVLKLFNTVRPDIAVFGAKDAQQAVVLKRMVREFDLPVRMVVAPTVREKSGLALSSRNAYLSPEERKRAVTLRRSLLFVRDALKAGRKDAKSVLAQARRIPAGKVQYLEAVHPETLEPAKVLQKGLLAAGAMKMGRTRLIDNITL